MGFIKLSLLFSFLTLCIYNKTFAQPGKSYDYLIQCFKNSKIDTADIEINGLGSVRTIDFNSNEMEETGLTCYTVPKNMQNKSPSKLSEIAADMHIQTWKNNSRVIKKIKYNSGAASVIDLRLHILIEDIYIQVIIIGDDNNMYEVMSIKDTNDYHHFDTLTKKIMERSCLQQ
jgi:hypothetical protein